MNKANAIEIGPQPLIKVNSHRCPVEGILSTEQTEVEKLILPTLTELQKQSYQAYELQAAKCGFTD